jgi:hypothetical protein
MSDSALTWSSVLGEGLVGGRAEVVEGGGHVRGPEVGVGLVLGAEVGARGLGAGEDVVERREEHLDLDVVHHLLDVAALVVVEALEHGRGVVEGVDPRVDDVVEGGGAGALVDVRREADALALGEDEVDDEHGEVLALLDLLGREEVAELAEGDDDEAGEALDDDAVDEVDVGGPHGGALGRLHDRLALLELLVDVLAALLDGRVARRAHGLVHALELLGRHGLALAREEGLLGPALHLGDDLAQVGLELEEHVVGGLDRGLGLAEEAVDEGRLPVEVLDAAQQGLVDLDELGLEERRLDGEHLGHHLVVHLHDEVEVARLAAEGLGLLVDLEGRGRDLEAEEEEVLDLAQEPDEGRVEVDGHERALDAAVGALGGRVMSGSLSFSCEERSTSAPHSSTRAPSNSSMAAMMVA